MHAVEISREILEFAKRGIYSRCKLDGLKVMAEGGIIWLQGDAGESPLFNDLGLQDVVVANRFLCHVKPAAADRCLRNIARLVKPGGYLFVSGIDLDVRTRVARGMGWKPVPDH